MHIWCLSRADRLHSHCWDDGAVVFDPTSGATHHVGLLAIELLSSLERTPKMSSHAFLEELSDVFDDGENGLMIVEDALLQLEALGLVRRNSA